MPLVATFPTLAQIQSHFRLKAIRTFSWMYLVCDPNSPPFATFRWFKGEFHGRDHGTYIDVAFGWGVGISHFTLEGKDC
jgi:hypothetical protein